MNRLTARIQSLCQNLLLAGALLTACPAMAQTHSSSLKEAKVDPNSKEMVEFAKHCELFSKANRNLIEGGQARPGREYEGIKHRCIGKLKKKMSRAQCKASGGQSLGDDGCFYDGFAPSFKKKSMFLLTNP